MKNVIILFFVLFTSVAGFAVEGVCNSGFGVESICVETDFTGGTIDIIQTMHDARVIVTDNDDDSGSVIVADVFNRVVFSEVFEGNGLVVVDKTSLRSGEYTLVAKAGATTEVLRFVIK